MGASLACKVYEQWGEDLSPPAFRLLVYMALTALDTDREPVYWKGREAMVSAVYGPAALRDDQQQHITGRRAHIRSYLTELRKRGVIQVVKKAAPGRNMHRGLRLDRDPTRSLRGDTLTGGLTGTPLTGSASGTPSELNGEPDRLATGSLTGSQRGAPQAPLRSIRSKDDKRAGRPLPRRAAALEADESRCTRPGCGQPESTHERWMEQIPDGDRHDFIPRSKTA